LQPLICTLKKTKIFSSDDEYISQLMIPADSVVIISDSKLKIEIMKLATTHLKTVNNNKKRKLEQSSGILIVSSQIPIDNYRNTRSSLTQAGSVKPETATTLLLKPQTEAEKTAEKLEKRKQAAKKAAETRAKKKLENFTSVLTDSNTKSDVDKHVISTKEHEKKLKEQQKKNENEVKALNTKNLKHTSQIKELKEANKLLVAKVTETTKTSKIAVSIIDAQPKEAVKVPMMVVVSLFFLFLIL
jgi:hypothetical protein